ncbi:MAG: phosphopyruvate hydratase [Candidatus Coatesbacteria bacterium RBG_13_66_14]|uniref:Enolase n=1 Tax=Candidatus Coatesbacteria bacterium RBG_13_66_14 TaxID=1817816 RepID=A0A1F5FH36_9BACT|nr:MAG: phosphopyruvate hydratase [Candidatus Coatesbacteria bacterium RBG_13_66_14]
MCKIASVVGREILDSRGNPTVEVEIFTNEDKLGRAMVPSGASTGEHEAVELRDGDKKRYHGLGVLKAVNNVNTEIRQLLVGMNPLDQENIDRALIELDGTPNKRRLGANAILGASVAVAKAAARHYDIPLYRYLGGAAARVIPVPMFNILNGGMHADNNVDMQEFMICPTGFPSFREALRAGSEIFRALGQVLKKQGYFIGVGDEGGYAPNLKSNAEAFEKLIEAIELAGYKPGGDVWIALDAAANSFYKDGNYRLEAVGKTFDTAGLIKVYCEWADMYPLICIEDGLAENDWEGFIELTRQLGDRIQITGDDIYVTNVERLREGIRRRASNSILIKLNQIGTVSETLLTMRTAFCSEMTCVVSHRSGETEDPAIAHLAVATNCGMIKAGAPNRSERLAKYNELLRIEESLETSEYPGIEVFNARAARNGGR